MMDFQTIICAFIILLLAGVLYLVRRQEMIDSEREDRR